MDLEKYKLHVPETKHEAVRKALEQTFKITDVDEICLLNGGLSLDLVYKITVNEKYYVLKILMSKDELNDPARQYICMKTASDAGITPKLHYSSVEDALAISDYIPSLPLLANFSSRDDLLINLAKVVKSIHNTTLFPKLVNFLDGIDIFINQFKGLNILPDSTTKEHFDYYAQIQKFYPRHDPDLVSSHNDLNVNNLLFDGKKIWIIDWQAAFQNDRYVDLSLIANFFVTNEQEENIYLNTYFENNVDEYKKARLFLMRQCCYMYYSMIFMRLAALTKNTDSIHSDSMDIPAVRDVQQKIGQGIVSIESYEGKLLYAKSLLNETLKNAKSDRFSESIKIVSK